MARDLDSLSPKERELYELLLKERQRSKPRSRIERIKRDEGLNCFPLSFSQQRLWFLHHLAPDDPSYNLSFPRWLHGELNIEALEECLSELVKRHESLRTTFGMEGDQPVQIIAPFESARLEVSDISHLPEEQRKAEAYRLAREEALLGFDLSRGPLFRRKLIRLGEKDHVLLLTMHHIVSDGWSMNILIREILTLYEAYSERDLGAQASLPAHPRHAGRDACAPRRESPLEELPIQYGDYAVWQRRYLEGEVLKEQMEYWKKQLGGELPVVEIASDYARPMVVTHIGGREAGRVGREVAEGIRRIGQEEGATLFMTMLAAFKVLLMRYSGEEEVIVGTPIAGRDREEIEGVIGFFVNTLALRVGLRGEPRFREAVRRVKEVALEAYGHQELPFEKLVDELEPERELGRQPLFQVMFAVEEGGRGRVEIPGMEVEGMEREAETAKFDISLMVKEVEEGLRIEIEYRKELYERESIRRMVEHYEVMLESVANNPEQSIWQIPLMSEKERHQALTEWNQPAADYSTARCLHELFEQQAERTPDQIALVSEDEQLSYRELNEKANRLARYLVRQRVGPESLIGISMERGIEIVVGLLGILKAGGAYVPLDPSYPTERIEMMLEDAQVSLLLTQESLADRFNSDKTKILRTDAEWEVISKESEQNPAIGIESHNPAYVIYTSGSTGKPKGVLISHHNVVRLMRATEEWFHFDAQDVWSLFHSFGFDFSVWEIWGALLYGGRLAIVPYVVSRSPKEFHEFLEREQVTMLNQTPSAFYQLIAADEQASSEKRLQSGLSLRTVIFGGEALEREKLSRWIERHGMERPTLVNGYGITETTVFVSYRTLAASDGADGLGTGIGKPMRDLQVHILDRHLQLQPAGVAGAMYVGGEGLARGYFRRPEMTAERFIPDSFSRNPGARLYESGDMARRLKNGELEYLGRIDHQIKIRGFRVELGELEVALEQHEAIRQAVVLAREDSKGDKRLVAYIVFESNQAATVGELRSFLKDKLPDYMVPASIVPLEAFPLNANGKLDRNALPSPEQARRDPKAEVVGPRDVIELRLVRIWEETLGVQPIGVKDNFFDLGGNSIMAVGLIARVENSLGVKLPLATLFQDGTVESQAVLLRRKSDLAGQSLLVQIQPLGSKPPFFAAHPAGGNVLCYVDLARRLGTDQPFYGLQSKGLFEERAHEHIEEMASDYIKTICEIQNEGPYHLGGWSFGAMVAFEMAQQLRRQGKEVGLLAMLDAGPGASDRGTARMQSMDDAAILANVLGGVIPLSIESLKELDSDEQLNHVLDLLKQTDGIPPDVGLDEFRRIFTVYKTNAQALLRYVPQTYPGRITLFKASDRTTNDDPREWALGWDRLAAEGVDVHVVPGNHFNIAFEPHVETLAERLKVCLVRAETTVKNMSQTSL